MTFRDLNSFTDAFIAAFHARVPLTELSAGAYAHMRYPKFLPLMRFSVKRYAAEGFGNLFSMNTRAMGGLMQLATFVCTPNQGTDVPLLLIDCMAMGKKRAVFVEYYDTTEQGAPQECFVTVFGRFHDLPDYVEKPAWYIERRTSYSLIKGGTDDARLIEMLQESMRVYAEACASHTERRAENLPRLAAFIHDMVNKGNPSSETLTKLLGKDGAETFYRSLVMPAQYTKQAI